LTRRTQRIRDFYENALGYITRKPSWCWHNPRDAKR